MALLAYAAPVTAQSSYEIVSVNSGRCLDVTDWSTANGARIQQWGCQGGANQQWIVQPAGNGFSTIVSAQSGKALDVSDWSLDNGAPIQQWDLHSGSNQQWLVQPLGAGASLISSRYS